MRQLSRRAVLAPAGLALAVIQCIEGLRYLGDTQYLSLLLLLSAGFGALASVKLYRDYCFECRFSLALISLSTVAGHALSSMFGLPGSAADPWAGTHAVLGALSLVLAVLILVLLLPRLFLYRSATEIGPPV